MKVGNILSLFALLALIGLATTTALGTVSCGPPPPPDAGIPCNGGFCQPDASVAVNFTIDATGRPGFYANGDLQWKGNFSYYDGGVPNRMLTPLTGWVGPFVPLYDDGPWNVPAKGHEPKGSTAGDNKFGATVFVPIPDGGNLNIEYGAQTKEGGWIWVGSNGSVTIPANSNTEVTADGLTLTPEGTVDVRLILDTTALGGGSAFSETPTITVKGTMSDWGDDHAYDDGTHGDAVAGDHIWTYTLTSNTSPKRLKQTTGTNCEFVWVFHPTQADGGIGSQEYKYGPNNGAGTGGVSAKTNKAGAGWVDAPVLQQTSGFYNTYIAIP